jgi:putative transposase
MLAQACRALDANARFVSAGEEAAQAHDEECTVCPFCSQSSQWEFAASLPNQKWVTDTKAVETAEGWLYLAVIRDLFSRLVVGWAMAAAEDEQLVELALRMALANRHPQAGLLHHSDRGSEFTSERYQAVLRAAGIEVSMSRTGNCYDNAAMEAFFATLTKECTDRVRFQTRQEARSAIFEYLECFYNPVRLHSTLQYLSPVAFEQAAQSSVGE